MIEAHGSYTKVSGLSENSETSETSDIYGLLEQDLNVLARGCGFVLVSVERRDSPDYIRDACEPSISFYFVAREGDTCDKESLWAGLEGITGYYTDFVFDPFLSGIFTK